ncbi:MAG: S8 family serine peptidase [Cycloclasticus sp.]
MNIKYKKSLFAIGLSACFAVSTAQAEKPAFIAGQVVVKGDSYDFSDYEVLKVLPHSGFVVLKVAPGKEMAQLRRFRDKGKKASLNLIVRQFVTPNDTGFSQQWNMPAVQAEQAWDITAGAGVKVAVIDSGLAVAGSSDGIACAVDAKNTIDGSTNVFDGNGHGTHVSGTIAQNTNNTTGVAGLAYAACVMPIKALSDSGSGTDADVAEAIAYAVDKGARVISMSLGYPAQYSLSDFAGYPSYSALNNVPNNVVVVVASGNDGASNVSYPASHPTAIAVGSVQAGNSIASYSNQGPSLDVVAPGSGIIQETRYGGTWGYYSYNGTSMAAPHVSAAAALLLSANNSLTKAEVLNKLKSSALDLGAAGEDSVYGAGLIQVADSLAGAGTPINQAPVASFSSTCDASFFCSFSSSSVDSDGSIVNLNWSFGDGSANVDTASPIIDHQFTSAGDYTVTLMASDDDEASSSTSELITLVAAVPEEIPSSVIATDKQNGTATIEWSYSDGSADSFNIERRKLNRKGNWSGASLIATVPVSTLSHTDSSGKGTFAYRVSATNGAGSTDWSNWAEVTVTGSTKGGGGGPGGGKGKKK